MSKKSDSCSVDDPLNHVGGKDDAYWKEKLSPEQYNILRQGGTEYPFTGKYWNHHDKGMYHCSGCSAPLFKSDTKFDSGTGWPSFFDVIDPAAVTLLADHSGGRQRVEVRCAKCGGHLGHVFEDGPRDKTGKRFCINSESLEFK